MEVDEEQALVEETSGHKKIINYLIGLTEDPEFLSQIRKIRIKYNIPPEGYSEIKVVPSDFNKGNMVIDSPEEVETHDFRRELNKFCAKYELSNPWDDLVKHYIVYNEFNLWIYGSVIETFDLKHAFMAEEDEEWYMEHIAEEVQHRPVAILVSPYVSQRDIIDYIKKMYKESIKPLQERYKKPNIKIGKIRKRNEQIKARNRFIYDNRKVKRKDLIRAVAEKYGSVLDYTYVNKIITDETKKRK